MNIFLANQSKQAIGGGWTFLNNFEKYGKKLNIVVDSAEKADVILISGATMVTRDTVEQWKKEGKKIVLRVDNIPRNSRNRGAGTTRLYDFAQIADLVIYQSGWAYEYIQPFIKKDGPIILNGADTEIFKLDGDERPRDGQPQYIYTRYNRDETKQWHIAWYDYAMLQRHFVNAHLWIVGEFSPELVEYGFDFFQNERFEYLGPISDREQMAELYRGADKFIYSYYNDACSNSLIEALHCGCEIVATVGAVDTGSYREIMLTWEDPDQRKHLSADQMVANYFNEIEKIL